MYGARFADMWAANNLDEVKKCWAYELRIFSVEQVGIAVGNLKGHNFPPTLPEFLTLCESARQQKPRRAVYVALPSKSTESNQSEEWHAAKARFMATVKASTPHKPSTEWAVKILRRFESGEHIPAHPIRLAREALQ